MTAAMHIAQRNIGRLVGPADDPRLAALMAARDRVNRIGERLRGFGCMMEGSGEHGRGNIDVKIGGNPRFVANLTVREDAEALRACVRKSVHGAFCDRRAEWIEVLGAPHFLMCRVPAGQWPTLVEALGRLDRLTADGDGDHAFGWPWLEEAGH